MALMIGDVVFPRDRVVPVFNRVDGIPDFAQLEPEGLTVTTGWRYRGEVNDVLVGIHDFTTPIMPDNLLRNYPDRMTMGNEEVFSATCDDLFLLKLGGEMALKQTPTGLSSTVSNLLRVILGSIYPHNRVPEAILGF